MPLLEIAAHAGGGWDHAHFATVHWRELELSLRLYADHVHLAGAMPGLTIQDVTGAGTPRLWDPDAAASPFDFQIRTFAEAAPLFPGYNCLLLKLHGLLISSPQMTKQVLDEFYSNLRFAADTFRLLLD